jgi:hypothetical protein
MSGLSNSFETALLNLLFANSNIANYGDATGIRGSTTAGSLFVALHTADPGEAGVQTTNEVSYTGYARVAVARSGSGWTVSGATVSNAAAVIFGQCTAGSATAKFWSIGRDTSGTGDILACGPLAGAPKAFTAKASTDVVTVPGLTLSVNDEVVITAIPSATLPTGITDGQLCFVKTVSGNDYTLSATQGGATIDLTADGAGLIAKVSGLAISVNVTPQFAIGQLSVTID